MASPTYSPPRSPGLADRGVPSALPGAGKQRRWSLALLAVLITLGSALAFVVLWMNAGGREPVLALAKNVPAGQRINDDDLKVVRVSADPGFRPVASSARDQVVGRPAAVDLVAGMLLVPDAVGNKSGLDSGTELIGVPVAPEEMPAGDLDRGDTVTLYRTGAQGPGGGSLMLGQGRVFEVERGDDDTSDIRVAVIISSDLGMDVSDAIKADRIYLAKSSAQG